MSQYQTKAVHEGATTGDLQDDEVPATAKSAEDRKAASALASLDAAGNEETITSNKAQVDREAVNKAMESLGGSKSTSAPKAAPSKNIRVDDADVAMLVDQLELPKVKATELLRAHDGDATKAMRAWIKA
ncbi:hypothetical protein E4U43_002057 [Claviceps pusilla]|uniref:Nascent polypeptide-associated complex subunit alpha-like UBA domain-containing protein n=1 Tax=Claviceps pusilla TaxID=123648 RepID=A0A9P7T3W5_9HYPO|nr:hypothetical protein E4U43_002057 [Claviceps pusilla]